MLLNYGLLKALIGINNSIVPKTTGPPNIHNRIPDIRTRKWDPAPLFWKLPLGSKSSHLEPYSMLAYVSSLEQLEPRVQAASAADGTGN